MASCGLPTVSWKNVQIATVVYTVSRKYPARVRGILRKAASKRLPDGFDVGTHFTPIYEPWDQRMCFVSDGDFFDSIRSGKAEVVTDHIAEFTKGGLGLRACASATTASSTPLLMMFSWSSS